MLCGKRACLWMAEMVECSGSLQGDDFHNALFDQSLPGHRVVRHARPSPRDSQKRLETLSAGHPSYEVLSSSQARCKPSVLQFTMALP